MTPTNKLFDSLLQEAANNPAHGIAIISAIALIQSEGMYISPDRYYLGQEQLDDMMRACIDHLKWHGHLTCEERPDGSALVQIKESEKPRQQAKSAELVGQVLSMAAMMEKALEILKNVDAEGGHEEQNLPDLIKKAETAIADVLKQHAVEAPSHG